MTDLIWLSEAQMRQLEPHFSLSHGVPRVDDRRIVSGIIFVIRNGLRLRDAPKEYGPQGDEDVCSHPSRLVDGDICSPVIEFSSVGNWR